MSEGMAKPIRVELVSRDAYWRKAVMVEWEYQFPGRAVAAEDGGEYVIEEAWLDDFTRVAGQCFSRVVRPPADPSRRRLFGRLFGPSALR